MNRFRGYRVIPIALAAFSLQSRLWAQAPATHEQHQQTAKPPAAQAKAPAKPVETTAVKSAAKHEEIFCSSMKTGQLCPESTAKILGLTGAQAEAWKSFVRKYNQSADFASAQLMKDSDAKLTPQQKEVLKAWFAIGWNEQINQLLYERNLDDLKTADTKGLKTTRDDAAPQESKDE